MRSSHSDLPADVLGWGCLYRADAVVPLGAFGVDIGVARLALGVAALPVLGGGGVCVHGDWFLPVKSLADMFHPLFVGLFASSEWFQQMLVLFSVGGVAVPWLAWALWG